MYDPNDPVSVATGPIVLPHDSNGVEADTIDVSRQGLLANVLQNTPVPIFIKDADGRYLFVNSSFLQITQLTEEAVIGRTDHDLFPSSAEIFRENDLLAMSSGSLIRRREVASLPDGQHSFISVKFPVRDDSGEVVGVCGISLDESNDVKAERARRDERRRIALELHDDAVQVMAAAALRLGALEQSVGEDDLAEKVADLRSMVEDSTTRLREMMTELADGEQECDLAARLEQFLAELHEEHGLSFRFLNNLDREVDCETASTLFKVAREALLNVVKHARASNVRVDLSGNNGVRLQVADDGVGFDDTPVRKGHLGLAGMRSRVEQLGGVFRLASFPGSGTRVDVWLPEGGDGAKQGS